MKAKILVVVMSLFSGVVFAQNHINSKISAGNKIDSLVYDYLNEINKDSIRSTIQSLQNFQTRFMLDTNRKSIANFIKDKYIKMGYENTVIDSFLTISNFDYFYNIVIQDTTWQYNVVATLQGVKYPDSICIVGAHYDSFSDSALVRKTPGADDDASGIAAAIEIARVFKNRNYQPEMSVKFIAFAAEELILFSTESGSSFYAKKAKANNEKIKFIANNDMIGYDKTTSNWRSHFNCFTGMTWIKDYSSYIAESYSLITPLILINNSWGDSHPFYENGFQTLHFDEFAYNPNYHKITDVVGSMNMDYCVEMTKISMAMLLESSKSYTSLNALDKQNNIIIYPNPAQDNCKIEFVVDKNEEVSLNVCDINGRLVHSRKIDAIIGKNNISLDILDLNGVYFVKLISSKDTRVLRLIVL
ncbi:MAG: M20/M25/M40 family metallo-hydrolase [Bacteroidota bacterium]